jgi:hypothetical protein
VASEAGRGASTDYGAGSEKTNGWRSISNSSSAMKAAAWERARGELRVVAALEGSYAGYNPGRSDDDATRC